MFSFSKMQKEHLDEVAKISHQQFPKTSWSVSQFSEGMDQSYICLYEKEVVGFLALQRTTYEMTILNIAVKEEFKRKHIATSLLLLAKDVAKQNNMESIFLEVETNNEPALRFYEKNGFELLRKRSNYYKDGSSCFEMKMNIVSKK